MISLYLEYKIVKNRPGLLGDLASLFGLLNVNISTIASIDDELRGLLIEVDTKEIERVLLNSLAKVDELEITTLREPQFLDILALKHGQKITEGNAPNYYKFERENLHLLIDFVSEFLRRNDKIGLIGIKGDPGVGKTETAIATAVHANKRWQIMSSTLLRKIARTKISDEFLKEDNLVIIDAITTFHRSTADHIKFIKKKILPSPVIKVVEHPDIFVKETEHVWNDFDLTVELLNERETSKELDDYLHSFNSFDIS